MASAKLGRHPEGHFGVKLGPSISETKCDRDNPIFSTETRGQSDHVEV